MKLLFSRFILFAIYSMVVAVAANAAAMHMSDFAISASIDKKSLAPIDVKNQFRDDIMEVWASVRIKHPEDGAKANIIWYHQGIKIKQNNINVESDMRLHAASLNRKKEYLFPKGKFRVDFILKGVKEGSVSFNFVPTKTQQIAKSKSQCVGPTKADNKILIADTLQNYPSMRDKIDALNLKRYHGRGDRFSTILPKAWEITKDPSPDVLLSLLIKTKQNKKSKYIIRELSVDELKGLTEANSTIMQTTVKLLADASLMVNEKSKLTIPPRVVSLPDITVGRLEALHTKNTKKFWERHTVIYDGKYLYDLALFTDNEDPGYRGFLSALSAYAFWTKESCR